MKKDFLILFLATCLILFANGVYGGGVQVLERDPVTVLYEPPLGAVSQEVATRYPGIMRELEGTLGWRINLRPTVLLVGDSSHFRRMAESPLTVAFAVPSRGLIVIDYSKMKRHPFKLEDTLKHEICHLLLHEHIKEKLLPRWLDEGVCQWASGGVVDIIMDQKRSLLNKAAFRGNFIPLSSLQRGFPRDKDSLLLAYEESESFVEHILGRYGKEGILAVLERMKGGEEAGIAVLRALSIPLQRLEEEWHRSLRRKMTWFTYLSYHLYEILFAFGALITVYAFIRAMRRKRAYMNEEGEG